MTPGESPISRIRRWFYAKPAALRTILAINVAVYAVIVLGGLFDGGTQAFRSFVSNIFALSPDVLAAVLRPWQFVTYSFVHLDPGFFGLLHIAFNLLWLVWVGQEYEELYGARQFTLIFLVSGVAGGVLTLFMHALLPNAAAFAGPVYGATAAVVGVIAAVVGRMPQKQIGLLFIGVVPLRYALLGFLVLDVLFGLRGGTFFAAHLGAAAFGYLYARAQTEGIGVGSWTSKEGSERRRSAVATETDEAEASLLGRLESWLASRDTGGSGPRKSPKRTAEPVYSGRVDQREVDRILDKISESGYESLSEEEKRILYDASRE